MRDRLMEFFPLLLVVALVFVYFGTNAGNSALSFLHLDTPEPTPIVVPTTAPRPTPPAQQVAQAQNATACTPAQPRFVAGFAQLKGALGAPMGDALDCEQGAGVSGDTQQRTTTGLAYYRKTLNAPCFTNGYDHWALVGGRGLVHWVGDAVDPPPDAAPATP